MSSPTSSEAATAGTAGVYVFYGSRLKALGFRVQGNEFRVDGLGFGA